MLKDIIQKHLNSVFFFTFLIAWEAAKNEYVDLSGFFSIHLDHLKIFKGPLISEGGMNKT